jgi:hypothetical protein
MGYELESAAPLNAPELDGDRRLQVLERRWQLANERLGAALGGYRALRGHVPPDDPAWLAAQLRVAQARQRCREASDDLELYASFAASFAFGY